MPADDQPGSCYRWARPAATLFLVLLVGAGAVDEVVDEVFDEVGLRAPLIAAGACASLDGPWRASLPSGFSIPARVPGEIVSDLHADGVIGDPLHELNFKRDAWRFEDA
ncbi:hypothetical protein T492DRAFT_896669 [Pavlovales sp. CCMP2436]|nr:hypothetical protein T492DRAFT_896669 [Pavlovales sp. CCMP2436]|mmetsp:Transcript_41179/g.96912  ORF Transcript_41179/g.96912 Transcript_41179/m.96912 type:complete len:109 (+) Transcript_41179:93-419(+)